MEETVLTNRQRNELEYYEKYSTLSAPQDVNFEPVTGTERRQWNSYWHFISLVQDQFKSTDQRLLDFGCGTGFYSAIFARVGYDVHGFDISPNNIAISNETAERYCLKEKCNFTVGVAEKLNYADNFFDVVTGVNILHHVDIRSSLAECMRVLRPGGIAVFHEPVRATGFDAIRESWIGTKIVSKEASFDRHITPDERKLSDEDFAIIRSFDQKATFERFLLTSRLDRFIASNSGKPSVLEQFDFKLFKLFPFVRRFGGECIITLRK
jgi:2-polyprenyl-3-methyl-5-hydroxy-6-metoxy-1,4-benzoquinol methylase